MRACAKLVCDTCHKCFCNLPFSFIERGMIRQKNRSLFKVPMKRIFFIILFERAFKMIKNGVYFIVIALLVAELFKILMYGN